MKKILLSFLLALVFNSCSTPASKVTSDYFSISGFLSAEENLLKEEKAWLVKEVTYEGKKEVKSIHHPDWKQELKPFLESAIDKPSTINAYSIDTITEPGTVIYLAKEKKVPVKRMAISYADNKPQTIHIEFEKSNSWFLHKQNLTFTSGKGFQIDGEQKMALGKTTKYSITCRFMK
jgi:hypothetical protein